MFFLDDFSTALENLREEFVYDGLNRLKTSTTSGLFSRTNDYTYDELGNLKTRTSKQGTSTVNDDIGTLAYDRTNNAGVHAVTSAGGQTYQYDKYGNMTKRGNETIEYNVFNKPVRITGATTTVLDYDTNHELFRETAGSAITYRFEGGRYEEIVEGTKTTQKSYVDGVILNTRTLNSGVLASNDTVYLHSDNLGSIEATSSKLGQFVNRMSFSDWGKRQLSDWKTGSPTDVFATADGYTGHHQLDQHKLVHMGGRVYDPGLGRFLSADLFVQSPYSSQSFNRYSYVANNPLSYVDPSGYECSDYISNKGTIWESHSFVTDTCGWNHMPGWTAADDFYDKENIYNKLAPLDPPDISEPPGRDNSPCPSCHGPAPDGAETTDADREILKDIACGLMRPCAMVDGIELFNKTGNPLYLAAAILPGKVGGKVGAKGPDFFRGSRPGDVLSFTPRPHDFKVDKITGFVKETHGISVFNNAASVQSKGFLPNKIDQSSIPNSLRVIQRGSDSSHFEITPKLGANLTPQQFIDACNKINCGL